MPIRMIMIAATMLTALAAPAVAAGTGSAEVVVRVRTADLDLTTAAGQRALDRRLYMAVTRLCGMPALYSHDELEALAACRSDAMASAATQREAARALQSRAVASNR